MIADVMSFERFDYFEFCTARIVSAVVLDLGRLEHEADSPSEGTGTQSSRHNLRSRDYPVG